MLTLTDIRKQYLAGDSAVEALRGITLRFRKSEFVSVLGPSGCGKTTLLNIIGGLDRYTSGDLQVNGRSTRDFKDRDWDSYRNHSIGFVFQNYNLIPHQSVLSNVELALTLSGVSRAERRRRAADALTKVGLEDQMHKRPNQMSGGQMQRVAIARALVNDPEILLADEPTGALDSATSVQIMEILKEISKDRLIIMVTHNPDLAAQYSTRIVRLLDGEVTDDTDPFSEEEDLAERAALASAESPKKKARKNKTSMSFFTALSLSTNNLMTKKARTFLTSFAGSIGIIGIALILALSHGIQTYIDTVQEDTLSSYPLTIQAENVDLSSLLTTLSGVSDGEPEHDREAVYANAVMYQLLNAMNSMETNENNLVDFKEFLDQEDSSFHDAISAIRYGYGQAPLVYTKDPEGNIVHSDITSMMKRISGEAFGMPTDEEEQSSIPFADMMSSSGFATIQLWEEMLSDKDGALLNDLLYEQYDLVHGSWPQKYDELVLVVDENNEVADISLYALGLKTTGQLQDILKNAAAGETVEVDESGWSYEDICNLSFRLVLPANIWQHDAATGDFVDLSESDAGLSYLYDNGIPLHITGIIRPNEDAVASMMSGSIGYTAALTDYIAEHNAESMALKAQKEDPKTDIFTGLPFKTDEHTEPTDAEKGVAIKEYFATLSATDKARLYTEIQSTPTDEYVKAAVEQGMQGMTREAIEGMTIQAYAEEMGISEQNLRDYIADMDDETLFSYVREMIAQTVRQQYAETVTAQLSAIPNAQLAAAFDASIPGYDAKTLADLYDRYMPPTVSEATYEENLEKLGFIDIKSPTNIQIYASTFADKDIIVEAIADYNASVTEEDRISYTDYVALMMSSITTIINAISYVLIAFVSISLVVSSIMIGIITYISVLERTKEIGILRSIGASKRDISRVFNAETLIIGFGAGAIGIGLTLLLCIPINAIVQALTDISSLHAVLPWQGAIILVAISMLLTFIAGLIPSRVAARKDPVVALRSE